MASQPKVITRYRNGVRTDTPIESAQVRSFARDLFGIDLGDDRLLFEDAEPAAPRAIPPSPNRAGFL